MSLLWKLLSKERQITVYTDHTEKSALSYRSHYLIIKPLQVNQRWYVVFLYNAVPVIYSFVLIVRTAWEVHSLGSYNFRAIFTHAWAGVTTLCSCKYFGNIDNPDPLMQYTNKKVITSIFCWSRILHEKISLYGEFMNYLKKCARHFLNLKTSFSWDDPIISTAKWVVPYKQETFVVFIPIRGKKIFSLIKSISFDIHGKVVKKGRKCDITLDLFPTKLQKNYPTRLSM